MAFISPSFRRALFAVAAAAAVVLPPRAMAEDASDYPY